MGISLISLRNGAKCWIIFLKRTKANFFPSFHNKSGYERIRIIRNSTLPNSAALKSSFEGVLISFEISQSCNCRTCRFSNSAQKCFNWFRFLIYPKFIRETLATFLCCSFCGLCESLVRSLRRFPSHKLRVFKENIFLHLDDHSSCCH